MSGSKDLTRNQINVHENTKKCEICDKEFKKNDGLKKHFNIVHNFVKELQCNICQKVFNVQHKLTLHVRTVHENKK